MKKRPRIGRAAGAAAATLSLAILCFSAKTAFATSTLQKKQIVYQNYTANVYGVVSGGTTYMPIWYIMHALQPAGFQSTWQGNLWNFTTPPGVQTNMNNGPLGTGSATLELNGQPIHRVMPIVRPDPNSHKPTTYMPIWYVMQLLTQAGVQSSWNGTTWTLQTGAPMPTSTPWNVAFVTNTSASLDDISQQLTGANVLASSAYDVQANGSLSGDGQTPVVSFAHARGLQAIARVDSMDKGTLESVMSNQTTRQQLESNIVAAIERDGDDGVNIDFEFMPSDQRQNFVTFLQDLHNALSAQGKTLSVDLPAVVDPTKESWNAGYDFGAIVAAVDKVILMAYDFSYPTSQPGAIAPLWWVNESVQYAVSQMPPQEVILGLDAYAYDWSSGPAEAYSDKTAENYAAQNGITPQWDVLDQAPYYSYTTNGVTHTVYYETVQSLTPRVNLAEQYGLGGISVWHAGLEDSSEAQLLNSFK
ncbi:glycosyl hydrolase family 18 protein [Alicyclobacillus dauci]|uniref:Glycosyl hydrolase family 18 protein n=1 Tax=Alicyclobacillus dauci TaxID=1475485 RepID=A0ABY6Z709_9BACL|nr:glycosyl hydrolase family 18 protein [Alicyclobacillus dauci]WAH38392.1 glycosyl hydrolase family 18 protein [Alicyclobacillus dauci]